jgi:thymidylate synthase
MINFSMLNTARERWRDWSGYYRLTRGDSLSETTYKVLEKLDALPNPQASRAGQTKELSPHLFEIGPGLYGTPDATTILIGRGNNPFATVAETLWVFAGRNDTDTLSRWLPRAHEYSDDGKHWDSGYGPRLRAWRAWRGKMECPPVNQIETVLRRLLKNQDSRQALITIWDPAVDGVKEGSKDYACTQVVHFLVRNGKLQVYVTMRSNDIIYGVAINAFEWCFLGRYIAHELNIPFSRYFHYGSSLHLYDWKGETARKILSRKFIPVPWLNRYPNKGLTVPHIPVDRLAEECNVIYDHAQKGEIDKLPLRSGLPSFLTDLYYALFAEKLLTEGMVPFLKVARLVQDTPLFLSLCDIAQRRRKEPVYENSEFRDLFSDTISEIRAAAYLRALMPETASVKPPRDFPKPKTEPPPPMNPQKDVPPVLGNM